MISITISQNLPEEILSQSIDIENCEIEFKMDSSNKSIFIEVNSFEVENLSDFFIEILDDIIEYVDKNNNSITNKVLEKIKERFNLIDSHYCG